MSFFFLNFLILFSIWSICVVCLIIDHENNQLRQRSSDINNSKNDEDLMFNNNETFKSDSDLYISEFEITEMINHDGRLQNGFCCNGLRTVPGQGCKGGNTTCLPFWRICIAELAPDMVSMMGREGGQHNVSMNYFQAYSSTTKKPSMIQNFFSKIFGMTNSKSITVDKHKYLKEIIEHMSSNTCHIGFWSSPVIFPDVTFPIVLRKLISFKNNKQYQSMISNRNFVSIVEIWSRNIRNDVKNRLIARQINHYNVFLDSDQQLSSEWFYGGKVIPTYLISDNNKSKENSSNRNRFRFRYRWHLKSLKNLRKEGFPLEELNQLNLTSEGCPQGYRGNDCNVPICLEGCHPDHGYCEQPGQCSCRFGWTGLLCDYCMTLPGCVHGTCNRPLECRCEEGWTGMFCSIPKCKDGCHSSNGYCTKPGECKCKFGWQGENCTECATLPGCQHGTCQEPLDCHCLPGWQGTFCSQPICLDGCENGWCSEPGECRCNVGFRGEKCQECVPYPGCQHGSCYDNKPWTCQCEEGYGGFVCDEKLDWCETNTNQTHNPCQNGGICTSIEHKNGDYFCKCLIGYTGKNCSQII